MNDSTYQTGRGEIAFGLQSASSKTTASTSASLSSVHARESGMGGTLKREVASELFQRGTGQPCTGKPRSQTLRLFIPPFARVCCSALENSLSSTTTSQSIWHDYEGQEYDIGVKLWEKGGSGATLEIPLPTNWPAWESLNCYIMLFLIQCQYL
jgi:hypothetical protein